MRKSFLGQNEIKIGVYKHKFHEVVMDASGEIQEYLVKPENIQMRKTRYELPRLRTKLLSKNLIAIRGTDNRLEIRKLDLTISLLKKVISIEKKRDTLMKRIPFLSVCPSLYCRL